MSRSDLERIQARLKVTIQNHQILVAKMNAEPQNTSLQTQLHELQSQITSLSQRQKMIVQSLRKEIVNTPIKQESMSPSVSPALPSPGHLQALNSLPQTSKSAAQPTRPLPTLAPKPEKDLTNNNNTKENVLSASQKANTAPLRVPQVHHRPSILQGATRQVPSKVTSSPLVPVSARRGPDTDFTNYKRFSISKDVLPEERNKLEFMASLDLITQETLKDLQNRRSERKRRSTANPQFSYGHFEPERKREAATYLNSAPILTGVRRSRGRPPKNRFLQVSPSQKSAAPQKPNNTIKSTETDHNDVHEDLCAVCHRNGDLLMCDTCHLVYHLTCLDPPMANIPTGTWSCPKCLIMNKQCSGNWSGTLALVHSYITHKAAKEEEKKKLNKQIKDLQQEKKQLDVRAQKLAETISQQVERKGEMLKAYSTAQQSVDKLRNLIRVFQTS